VDYSTNKYVANYYSGGDAKYFRHHRLLEIDQRVKNGEHVLLGLDYYALIYGLMPEGLLKDKQIQKDLLNGKVYVFEVYADSVLYWKDLLNKKTYVFMSSK